MDEASKSRVMAFRVGGIAVASTASWLLCKWFFYPMDPQSFAVVIGLVGLFGGWVAGRLCKRGRAKK